MALTAELINTLTRGDAKAAWAAVVDHAMAVCSKPLASGNAPGEVVKRDREVGTLDHFLTSAGWDLWKAFAQPELCGIERTSDRLARWWTEPFNAKAVLILDGLSLRELPWLLQGAKERGYTVHGVEATAAEIPGETNKFAKAIGVNSRSQLQNNGAGLTHRLQPTATESVDLPWKDCEHLVSGSLNWVFWHHWPDSKLHDGSGAGQGLDGLTKDAAEQLSSDDFWAFVDRLATGRRLVITSDHGYAATGLFPDADGDVGQFLKKTFAAGRSTPGAGELGPFIPPVALEITSPHGTHRLALGRRKWKSPGGYPTLTHGGLSLLEVLSPYIELSK